MADDVAVVLIFSRVFSGGIMTKAALGICAAVAAALCGACASSSDKISAQYISPMQYHSYNCTQLSQEAQRVSARVAQLSGVQDQKATTDAIATGVAIVVFWPAAFLVGGNDHNSAELARLKGEFETVEKVAIEKNCGLNIQQKPAPTKRREPSA